MQRPFFVITTNSKISKAPSFEIHSIIPSISMVTGKYAARYLKQPRSRFLRRFMSDLTRYLSKERELGPT